MAGDFTRSAIRHRIAREVEPYFVESTSTATNTTTLTDTVELVNYNDDFLIGAFVYLYGTGTGTGQERRITDSVQSTGVITVPTWTDPADAIAYEIHRGLRVKNYNDAINMAIRSVADYGKAWVAKIADTSLTLTNDGTSTGYFYTVPAGFRYIQKILYESPEAGVYDYEVPPGAWWWSLEKLTIPTSSADATWQWRVDRRYWEPIAGRKARIIGAGSPDECSADTELISEHIADYVVHRAAYTLLSMHRDGVGADARSNSDRAREQATFAGDARTLMRHMPPPSVRVLPR